MAYPKIVADGFAAEEALDALNVATRERLARTHGQAFADRWYREVLTNSTIAKAQFLAIVIEEYGRAQITTFAAIRRECSSNK